MALPYGIGRTDLLSDEKQLSPISSVGPVKVRHLVPDDRREQSQKEKT